VQRRMIQVCMTLAALFALGALSTSSAFAAPISPTTGASASVTNPYLPTYQHSYRHGAIPTITQLSKINTYSHEQTKVAISSNTLYYSGGIDGIGVTSGPEKVYVVFWGKQWGTKSTDSNGNLTFSKDSAGASARLQNFFKGLGTGGETWSGTVTQYCDGSKVKSGATSCPAGAAHVGYPTGGAFAGAWYDNSASEPSVASGHQLATEAIKAASHFGNTTAASNRYAQYFIVSPSGTNPDDYQNGGFCAWHDYNGDSGLSGGPVTSTVGDVSFTNLPYLLDAGTGCGQNFVNSGTAGNLDGFTIVGGHEYSETITDQNPAGGWIAQDGEENADECAWIAPGTAGGAGNIKTGNGSYPTQGSWSNDTNSCALTHTIIK
jgi:hypothetical protein